MKYIRKFFQSVLEVVFRILAKLVLAKYKPTVVAVTGNVGKTTTKDVIATMLASQMNVRATIRSQNSDLTTPLSIFGREVHSKERNPLVRPSIGRDFVSYF